MPVLLIEATEEVSASTNSASANVVRELLESQHIAFDHLKVSNIAAIAPAAWVGLDSAEYEGLIVLGCTINETEHNNTIFHECARNVHDVAMQHSVALGFGVIVSSNPNEAQDAAIAASKLAAQACIEVLRIVDHYRVLIHETDPSPYQN